jgi:hypothetical protein
MQRFTRAERQAIACGYEPLHPLSTAWIHEGMKIRIVTHDDGTTTSDRPKTCPGYTTTLPEVIEASQARLFFGKGELLAFTGGEPPTDALRASIVHLEIAAGEMQEWLLTPKSKGGGGAD